MYPHGLGRPVRTAAVLVTVAVLLAGCLGADPADTDTASVPGAADDTTLSADMANATANATSPSDLTGGHAPHIHNYWGESDRITLFDGEEKIDATERESFFAFFLDQKPAFGATFFELPDGATIYEGTGQLLVTAAWTEPTITGLALRYHSPDMKSGFTEWSEAVPLPSGQPVTIEVTPAMTDMPHDAKSRWAFMIGATGDPGGVAQGTVHLTFEIARMRDIMLFPGHPDNYEDTDHYLLAENEPFEAKSTNRLTWLPRYVLKDGTNTWYPSKAIPLETRALILTIQIVSGGATAPLAEQSGIDVQYTSAETMRGYRAQLLNNTEDIYVFAVPVDDTMVDSPYRDESAWHFNINPRQKFDIPVRDGCPGCVDYDMKVQITLVAWDHDPTGGHIETRPGSSGR